MLTAVGTELSVQTLPDPVLGTGDVIVDVAAAAALPYSAEVFSGATICSPGRRADSGHHRAGV